MLSEKEVASNKGKKTMVTMQATKRVVCGSVYGAINVVQKLSSLEADDRIRTFIKKVGEWLS